MSYRIRVRTAHRNDAAQPADAWAYEHPAGYEGSAAPRAATTPTAAPNIRSPAARPPTTTH